MAHGDIEKITTDELPDYPVDRKASGQGRRKSSAVNPEILAGEIFDERFEKTQRGLKSRHAQMIALGGTIGTGLFVGSGQTLARGGPAFILGCYCFIAFLVYCVVTAIIEVAAYLPTPGSSMNLFGYRYVSRSMGFRCVAPSVPCTRYRMKSANT